MIKFYLKIFTLKFLHAEKRMIEEAQKFRANDVLYVKYVTHNILDILEVLVYRINSIIGTKLWQILTLKGS